MSKTNWVSVRFDGKHLVPTSEADLQFLRDRYPHGTDLKAQVSQSRSLKHHNLYWGVLRRVVEINGGEPWHNAEALDVAIKAQLGMYGPALTLMDGTVRFELQSISFSSMDQAEFKHFFESAMQAIGDCANLDMFHVVESVKNNLGWSAKDEELFKIPVDRKRAPSRSG